MKIMLKLVVLLATLLLLTGMAFASCFDSACYSVDGTNVTNPALNFTGQIWQICFGNTPATINVIPAVAPMSNPTLIGVFTDGLILQAVGSSPNGSAGNGIYMKFHGSDNDIFNGIFAPNGIEKYRIHGIRVQCIA